MENRNYIKKLFVLEDNGSFEAFPFYLKEIKIIDKDDANSRIIPIKIFIGQKRTYFLCINENKLIDEIIQNDKKNEIENKIQIPMKCNIQGPKEEHNLETLQKIYFSDNLNKFIGSFNSFSDKNIKDLIKTFDKMIKGSLKGDIKINDINYNELILFLRNKNELIDLLSFFLNNENNEGKILFNYLKKRISLIEENKLNYLDIKNYLDTEGFVKKIVEQNMICLNDDFRIKYFQSILKNMVYPVYDYELDILVIIDRFSKAAKFKKEYNQNRIPDINLTETEFGQLFHSLSDLNGKRFLIKQGERLFYTKLKGEFAIDAGGPYSEILSDICDDLQSDYVKLFIKTPNNENNVGLLQKDI